MRKLIILRPELADKKYNAQLLAATHQAIDNFQIIYKDFQDDVHKLFSNQQIGRIEVLNKTFSKINLEYRTENISGFTFNILEKDEYKQMYRCYILLCDEYKDNLDANHQFTCLNLSHFIEIIIDPKIGNIQWSKSDYGHTARVACKFEDLLKVLKQMFYDIYACNLFRIFQDWKDKNKCSMLKVDYLVFIDKLFNKPNYAYYSFRKWLKDKEIYTIDNYINLWDSFMLYHNSYRLNYSNSLLEKSINQLRFLPKVYNNSDLHQLIPPKIKNQSQQNDYHVENHVSGKYLFLRVIKEVPSNKGNIDKKRLIGIFDTYVHLGSEKIIPNKNIHVLRPVLDYLEIIIFEKS